MSYWRTYYHIVWATKHRTPVISPDMEAVIFPSMVYRASELGAIVYALNGTEDHVHLVAAIPPRVAVAQVIGELKGRSSYIANRKLNAGFEWQRGYGVQTFGEKHLRFVVEYVQNQKDHHAMQTLYPSLERCIDKNDAPPPVLPGERS